MRGASIASIADNGDGTVTVLLAPGDREFKSYEILYTIVAEGESYIPLDSFDDLQFNVPSGQRVSRDEPFNVPRTMNIVPGYDLQFYVRSYDDYTSSAWWKADRLYHFPENGDMWDVPIQLLNVEYCVWDSYDDFKAFRDVQFDYRGQPFSALPQLPVRGFPSTAAELTQLVSHYRPIPSEPGEIIDELALIFHTELDVNGYLDWWNSGDRLETLLLGPGIAVKSSNTNPVMPYVGDGICMRALNGGTVLYEAYKSFRSRGGFPAGDYTLRYFYNGTPVGDWSFALG